MNAMKLVSRNITLGYHVFDSCTDARKAVKSVLQILSGPTKTVPNYSCMDRNKLAGFIGDHHSITTIPLAQILSVYRYSQISYGATDYVLNDRHLYPNFFRMLQNYHVYYKIICQLLKHFGWTWVGIVSSYDDTGETEELALKKYMAYYGICMAFKLKLDNYALSHTPEKTMRQVQAVQNTSANVIIVFGSTNYIVLKTLLIGRDIFKGKILVFPPSWVSNDILRDYFINIFEGSLYIELYPLPLPDSGRFFEYIRPSKRPNDKLLENIWISELKCLSPNASKNRFYETVYKTTLLNCTGKEPSINAKENLHRGVTPRVHQKESKMGARPPLRPPPSRTALSKSLLSVMKVYFLLRMHMHGMMNLMYTIRRKSTRNKLDWGYQGMYFGGFVKMHRGGFTLFYSILRSRDRPQEGLACCGAELARIQGGGGGGGRAAKTPLHSNLNLMCTQTQGSVHQKRGPRRCKDDLCKELIDIYDVLILTSDILYTTKSRSFLLNVGIITKLCAQCLEPSGSTRSIRQQKINHFYQKVCWSGREWQEKTTCNEGTWGSQDPEMPRSQCTESCFPGYRKISRIGGDICCYDCVPCGEGEISNKSDSEECIKCTEDEWPNQWKDQCIPKVVEFLSYDNDVISAVFSFFSLLLFLIAIVVLVIYHSFKDSAIVKANNRNLSFILLVSIMLSYLCVFLFLGRPVDITCMLRQCTFAIIFSISISCVMGKTVMIYIVFKASKPGSAWRKWVSVNVSNSVVLIFSSIQIIINITWLIILPPFQELDKHSYSEKIIVQCNEGSVIAFYSVLGYMGFLAAVSFILAFFARTLPDSFNEAKYITFSMLVFCSVWIAMIPAYLSTRGKNIIAVEIFAILTSSSGLLGCIFFPKCYLILTKLLGFWVAAHK
ncbi:vomeronasal type-2 receptor 26-like, partial [Pelobates cultripes]